jgi:hypothetical protein
MEQRIHTLAHNVVDRANTTQTGFTTEEVSFSSWQREPGDDWMTHQYWLASTDIEANDYIAAWRLFIKDLVRIVPKMALVSQCYMEHLAQPILIHRTDSDVAFVWWVLDRRPTGLMFMEDEKRALDLLLEHPGIPKEFFYYWRDAVNTFGYSSKLLIMLSAVEALTGIPLAERRKSPNFYSRLEQILGPELKRVFWGTDKDHSNALRHRLVHGEYFDPQDDGGTDYNTLIHRRVMKYFNEEIFKESLLDDDIVSPQRHLIGNADQARSFIRPRRDARLCLIKVLTDADKNGFDQLENYETLQFADFNDWY